jgi:hypothetical protein
MQVHFSSEIKKRRLSGEISITRGNWMESVMDRMENIGSSENMRIDQSGKLKSNLFHFQVLKGFKCGVLTDVLILGFPRVGYYFVNYHIRVKVHCTAFLCRS